MYLYVFFFIFGSSFSFLSTLDFNLKIDWILLKQVVIVLEKLFYM